MGDPEQQRLAPQSLTYLLVGTGVSATFHLDRGTILSLESSVVYREAE